MSKYSRRARKAERDRLREEWEATQEQKENEAIDIERLNCPHCGKHDIVEYVMIDQRKKYERKWE